MSDTLEHLRKHKKFGEEITNVEDMEYPIDSSKYRRAAAKETDVTEESNLIEADNFFNPKKPE
jgi:hypothetical protein